MEFTIEGRNAVIEAFRAGKTIDRLYILDGCKDGPIMTIKREASKQATMIKYVSKERLEQMSGGGKHQGVIASVAAYGYAEVEDILQRAPGKGEPPLSCSLMVWRIPIIWEQSSGLRIRPVPMGSLSPKTVR